jgi:hypothetical protein
VLHTIYPISINRININKIKQIKYTLDGGDEVSFVELLLLLFVVVVLELDVGLLIKLNGGNIGGGGGKEN